MLTPLTLKWVSQYLFEISCNILIASGIIENLNTFLLVAQKKFSHEGGLKRQ